jgi:hypothetical protein
MGNAIRFIQGVEREGRSGLALAPAAMTGVNDERRPRRAGAVQVKYKQGNCAFARISVKELNVEYFC